MGYFDEDISIERSKPIEVFTWTSQRLLTPVIARTTSYHRDTTVAGIPFVARPIRRSAAPIRNASTDVLEMQVEVAVTDPVAQFYLGLEVPPQNFECYIQRYQPAAVAAQDIFRGVVNDARQSGQSVTFTITQRTDDALQTKFPSNQISKLCQHVFMDSRCGIIRTGQQVNTTISAIGDYRTLTVATMVPFGVDGSFARGELLHQPSGERRHVLLSTAATKQVKLDVRLPSSALNGDGVVLWRGCDRAATTCRDKFANIVNFSGMPDLAPKSGIWTPQSLFGKYGESASHFCRSDVP